MAAGVLVLALGWFGWRRLTSPVGDQTVQFVAPRVECLASKEGASRPWKACVHWPAQGQVLNTTAYYLHGRNLDEHAWVDDTYFTSMVQAFWQEHQLIPPVVVAVSFGPVWLLAPSGAASESGLLEVFMNEVVPTVEQRFSLSPRRVLFGESMGGTNALLAGLHSPASFARIAALCPVVSSHSPFESFGDLRDAAAHTGADPKLVFGVVRLAKRYFASAEEWAAVAPGEAGLRRAKAEGVDLYLSCGLYDAYGNYARTEALAHEAQAIGLTVDWHPLYGGHCATDISSLAQFLARP